MKFSCLQENLNRGLTQTGHLATKNISLPILNNVLIQCEDGIIKLSATNLEVGINTVVRGKVESGGRLTVPAKTLTDYISLLSDEKIELESEGVELKITTKNSRTTIKGQSADEFPLIPSIDRKNHSQTKTKDFKKAVAQVVYAVAQDESRPEISGVYLRFAASNLTLVATDSYRLAEKTIKLTQPVKEPLEVIVPTRTIQELSRVASDSAEYFDFYPVENQILFVCEGVELISRLIEGRYPDYKQIIPHESKTTIVFEKEEMIKAVKAAALFSKSGINDVSLNVNPSAGKIVVGSTNTQLGESSTDVAGEGSGDSNATVFNHRFFLDGLLNLEGDRASLALIDGSNPGTLKQAAAGNFLYIIMPIKQ